MFKKFTPYLKKIITSPFLGKGVLLKICSSLINFILLYFVYPTRKVIKQEGLFHVFISVIFFLIFFLFVPLVLIVSSIKNDVLFFFLISIVLYVYANFGDNPKVKFFLTFYVILAIIIKTFLFI